MDKMSMSISMQKSTKRTNLKHNNRMMSEKEKKINNHIDYSKSAENKYLVQEDIKNIYKREFGKALENYNAKQKRKDRKIDDYYKHIQSSKKTALQQEMIIQIGDQDDFKNADNRKLANEILENWFSDFEKRNPNLKVYNAVIHNDEASPHMHLNFVPVASGYKRGLEKQVSFDRAIIQQDSTLDKVRPFDDWRDKEVKLLEQKLLERGIRRKLVGKNEYKDVNEMKKVVAAREKLEKEKELLKKEKELFLENQTEIKPIALKLTYSHKEKVIEQYETTEKNFMGIEKTVIKNKQKETGNYVMTQKQIQNIQKVFNSHSQLEAQNKRLATLLKKEMVLREEREKEHERHLKMISNDINERAERLKDKKIGEVEKRNQGLNQELGIVKKKNKMLVDEYRKMLEGKKEMEDELKQVALANERLQEENNNLRKTIDYFKKRFEKLWHVTKDYLQHTSDGVETVKEWFKMDTGEEIESRDQYQKNKSKSHDIEF